VTLRERSRFVFLYLKRAKLGRMPVGAGPEARGCTRLGLSRKSRTATRGDEGKISARSFHALPTIAPAAQLLPTALVGRSLSQGKAPRKATLTAAGRRRPELPQGREHSQLRSWALSRVRSGFWMSFSPSAHTSAKGRQRPFFRELVSQFRARVALPPERDNARANRRSSRDGRAASCARVTRRSRGTTPSRRFEPVSPGGTERCSNQVVLCVDAVSVV
jgi:hypothetical protein